MIPSHQNEGFKDAKNIVNIMVMTVSGKGGGHIRRYYSNTFVVVCCGKRNPLKHDLTIQGNYIMFGS